MWPTRTATQVGGRGTLLEHHIITIGLLLDTYSLRNPETLTFSAALHSCGGIGRASGMCTHRILAIISHSIVIA